MLNGYIALHRKFLNWEWYGEPLIVAVFVHCLIKANWRDKSWRGETIKRGSFKTSYDHLAQEVGISVQELRSRLNKLEMTGEITRQSTNKNTLITVVNYELYQDTTDDSNKQNNTTTTDETTNEQQTSNNQTTNNQQQLNNNNNINNRIIEGDVKNAPPAPPKKKTVKTRGTRLPDDWKLSPELGEWAEAQGMSRQEILQECEVFRNYWHSLAGAKAVKVNWDLTFKNWIYRAMENKAKRSF